VHLCCLCLPFIYCFFRLFAPVDPETDAAAEYDYVTDDPSSPSAELPGKQNPLDHHISPILFFLMLALEMPLLLFR
ncbi:hypothetical protein, partial [Ralstonia pseudosolanacearum]|uniref:hypothetical protein n=1 Tax=Ralstonia pseudosolanacearum TaxID=1310165 RepID=UPI003CF7BC83